MCEGVWHGVNKSIGESANGADGGVGRRAFGNGTITGKKINSFDDAFSSGFGNLHPVETIVFMSAANVPTSDAMGGPGAANSRSLKDKDFGAGRSKGSAIEIESSIELGFDREAGVDARR